MERSDMINEAILRMRKLDIIEDAVKQFEDKGVIMCSENPYGALYTLNEEQAEIVKAFEKEHNALVYLAIRAFSATDEMISLLYVSNEKEEWYIDREDIDNGFALAYAYNFTAPYCSEIGYIQIRPVNGGLIRIC